MAHLWVSKEARDKVMVMANKADHVDWAEGNAEFSERLWESTDLVERRWSAVVDYYATRQAAHAVAPDLWNENPRDHFEVRNVVLRTDTRRIGLAPRVGNDLGRGPLHRRRDSLPTSPGKTMAMAHLWHPLAVEHEAHPCLMAPGTATGS